MNEGWSSDVSEDMASATLEAARAAGKSLSATRARFCERHLRLPVPAELLA